MLIEPPQDILKIDFLTPHKLPFYINLYIAALGLQLLENILYGVTYEKIGTCKYKSNLYKIVINKNKKALHQKLKSIRWVYLFSIVFSVL